MLTLCMKKKTEKNCKKYLYCAMLTLFMKKICKKIVKNICIVQC